MISLLNLMILLLLSPLLQGVVNKTKAWLGGRTGQPVLQPYFDIAKLLRKKTVLSRTTSFMFLLGPAVSIVAIAIAGTMLPVAGMASPIAFPGDVILFIYLFAITRFFTTLAALDTGSSFEGMGAARELTFSCLAEPALFFGFLALARISDSLDLSTMLSVSGVEWRSSSAAIVLIVTSWFIVLLAENSRVPFDDPNTHLELTMIHEVMVLDHGGPALGIVMYASAMKLFIFSSLLARLLAPRLDSGLLDAAMSVAWVLLVGVVVGVMESFVARLRLVRVPQLLITAVVVSGFAVILVVR